MALHTQLPIYRVAYDLLDTITDLARNMPRDECVEIVVAIFRANCAREKLPHIETLLERLQVAELLLRLSRDKRLIGRCLSSNQLWLANRKSTSIAQRQRS